MMMIPQLMGIKQDIIRIHFIKNNNFIPNI